MANLREALEEDRAENEAIQLRIDAETEANLVELAGARDAKREDAKTPKGQAIFDRLRSSNGFRPIGEIIAIADDLDGLIKRGVLDGTRAGDFIRGQRDALVNTLDEDSSALALKDREVVIEELALFEADQIRIQAGIVPHKEIPVMFLWSYLDGSVVAYEWALGQRETLDHRSDSRPSEAAVIIENSEPRTE
jgi:hypothetical protein